MGVMLITQLIVGSTSSQQALTFASAANHLSAQSLASQHAPTFASAANHLLTQSLASQQAPTTASAANHLSAQYSQFLASVRDFNPLVADLNTSIASVATSVTTMGADVNSRGIAEASVTDSHHCADDVIIHSPISQPLQHKPDQYDQGLSLQQDGITQNHGNIRTFVVCSRCCINLGTCPRKNCLGCSDFVFGFEYLIVGSTA